MDTRLPPAIQQALRPHMKLTESERQSVDIAIARWKASHEAQALNLTESERKSVDIAIARWQAGHHARNDARALRLQQAEQRRNDWSATV